MKRVEIDFYDSNFMHGWEAESEDELAKVTAIGFLKSEDDSQLTIVMAYSHFGLKFAKLTVPRSSVVSIKEVRIK